MVSQRSRTPEVSFRAHIVIPSAHCHSVSFRVHSVIPSAQCHSEGSEESKYLAPGLRSQILRCAQNDVDGQNDVAGGWMTWLAVGCFTGVDG